MSKWQRPRGASGFYTPLLGRAQGKAHLQAKTLATRRALKEHGVPGTHDSQPKRDGSACAPGFSWVISSPAFLRLWLAQILSQTALNAATYGLIILVAKQSGSVTATAVTIVAFTLPVVIWSLPAGILIDRLDRRQVLWVINALRSGASLLCVTTLFINQAALLPLY